MKETRRPISEAIAPTAVVENVAPQVDGGRFAVKRVVGEEIAGTLRLSEGTVRNYLSEAISKLGASNRVEAARIARTKGWL